MLAAFRKPKTQNTGAKFNASHSLCNISQLSLVNRMACAAFEIYACKLDAIFAIF
jgi:hypothetical protein